MLRSLVSRLVLTAILLSLSLPAAAASLENQKSTSSLNINQDQLLCVQDAVFLRETAVMGALNTFYTRMQKTLEARRALIKAAWDIKDGAKRRTTLKAIWKKFGFTWKTERELMSTSMRKAWDDYRIARTECKVAGYDEETGGLSMDSQF
jgi:hypothetical protein